MCFLDMTFCSQCCGNTACHRNSEQIFSKHGALHAQYEAWSKHFKDGGPVALGDMKTDDCGFIASAVAI